MTINYYYNRFDPASEYEKHLFRAGYVLQSAEQNEIQDNLLYKLKQVADVLFKNGDIIAGATVRVDNITGATTCEAGKIYLQGAVRAVPAGSFTVPTTGTVSIGVFIATTEVTEVDDPTLRDPAQITRNYQQPGAGRLKMHTAWGYYGDGSLGDFYPVYSATNGILQMKEPPPSLDSVTQAIAIYDRDTAGSGGSYVVSGMNVTQLSDDGSGNQVYSIAQGRARVNGLALTLATSLRVTYPAVPDLMPVANEPHVSSTSGSQVVPFNNTPGTAITEVLVTAQTTLTVTRGLTSNGSDFVINNLLDVSNVHQGGTTYVKNTDFIVSGNNISWAPTGGGTAEPAGGSTYSVTCTYSTTVTPSAVTDNNFTITGAVSGTTIYVSYSQKLPRYDRLVVDQSGNISWIKGVAAQFNARYPTVPNDKLALATVVQTWTSSRQTINDGFRVVSMNDLQTINNRIDYLLGMVARQQLASNITLIDSAQKLGMFTDPFLDDSLRDVGTSQTAAIFGGGLTLPVAINSVNTLPSDVTQRTALNYSQSAIVSQLSRTSAIKINPYLAFSPISANVTLKPAIDKWTDINVVWASPITERVTIYDKGYHGSGLNYTKTTTNEQLLSASRTNEEFIRQTVVNFVVSGFGAGETLTSVTFDGITVTATAP